MANVVDPNSWRMVPLPHSHTPKLLRSDATSAGPAAGTISPAVSRLAVALERTFGAANDRVVWRLQGADGELQLRIDSSHEFVRVAQPSGSQPATDSGPPWLVLVQTAQEIGSENGSPEVRAALEQDARLLLVVCGMEDAHTPPAGQRALAEHVAARLRLRYWEPLTLENEDLASILAEVKHSGNSSVLYFDASSAPPSPHFLPVEPVATPPVQAARAYRALALDSLHALKATDPRVTYFLTDGDVRHQERQHGQGNVAAVLEHCLSIAAAGQRPCVFLSLDEALLTLPTIRRVLAERHSGITLVIEARGDGYNPARSSQLAVLRELDEVSLLAPKDGLELGQMLAWCVQQSTPAILWLAETEEPPVTWPLGEAVTSGRAERLGAGADVTLVAWGSTNAAAAIAAENLAQLGIRATVVNARFAQPLDVDAFATACAESAYTVLLDDADTGGFAAWVCEQLVRCGLAPNMTIVSPGAIVAVESSDPRHAMAQVVVDRCRWLGERLPEGPLAPNWSIGSIAAVAPPLARVELPLPARAIAPIQSEVLATSLSEDVWRWVRAYEEVGSRDVYLWQWCAHGVEITMLPSVTAQLRAHVRDTKVLSIVLCVLLDDVADEHGDGDLLEALLGLTFADQNGSLRPQQGLKTRHAEITRDLWGEYWYRVSGYPRFSEFEPVLRYDLQQFQNTMRYSHLINEHPYLLNVAEHDLYTSHNMMIVSFATIDLMCSPGFPLSEVGAVREMAWHAQCMGRYGNLLSTWRRELANNDYTSGVFARAVAQGHLTYEDLARHDRDAGRIEAMIQNRGHEAHFYERWLEHRCRCHECARRVASLDLQGVLNGHDQFFAMHLGSEGLI